MEETEVTLEEDVTPITSVTDVIETIIEEATDTQKNLNSEQSKEVGFWSLEEDDGVPSPTKVTCDMCEKEVDYTDELQIHI